jgi:hypothetical protein
MLLEIVRFLGRLNMEDDQKILTLPAARPEFMNLSEADVWKAIADDPWQCNPVTGEVTRLVVQCMSKCKAHFHQHGYESPRVLLITAGCAIEKVAVLLFVRFIEAEAACCPVIFH